MDYGCWYTRIQSFKFNTHGLTNCAQKHGVWSGFKLIKIRSCTHKPEAQHTSEKKDLGKVKPITLRWRDTFRVHLDLDWQVHLCKTGSGLASALVSSSLTSSHCMQFYHVSFILCMPPPPCPSDTLRFVFCLTRSPFSKPLCQIVRGDSDFIAHNK